MSRTEVEGIASEESAATSGARAPGRARRILIVHSSADLYGSDRACLVAATAAVGAGFDTHVALPAAGPLVQLLRAAGVVVHVTDVLVLRRADLRGLRALRVPFTWVRALVLLRRFARRERFDLVHTNCAPTLGGAVLARWLGAPHVWHVHEVFSNSRAQRLVFGRLIRMGADVIVAASRAVAGQFADAPGAPPVRVVYTGADVPDGIVATVPLAHAPYHLVCVGRINAGKGQAVLIDAVAELRAAGVDVQLAIVGDVYASQVHFRERLEEQAAGLGLDGVVSFLGERSDALELMANSDIVVIPSVHPEGFGMVAVEALALARPTVATAAGALAEIIADGRNGLLVEPGDASALAGAIKRLIDDPAAARSLGARGVKTAAALTSRHFAEGVLAVYADVLERSQRAVASFPG